MERKCALTSQQWQEEVINECVAFARLPVSVFTKQKSRDVAPCGSLSCNWMLETKHDSPAPTIRSSRRTGLFSSKLLFVRFWRDFPVCANSDWRSEIVAAGYTTIALILAQSDSKSHLKRFSITPAMSNRTNCYENCNFLTLKHQNDFNVASSSLAAAIFAENEARVTSLMTYWCTMN